MVSSQSEKMKTKAKQRYLKAKRDKRKKRKAAAAEAAQRGVIKERVKEKQETARLQRDAEINFQGIEAKSTSGESSDELEPDDTVVQEIKNEERPRKKRKVDKAYATPAVTLSPSLPPSPKNIEDAGMDEDLQGLLSTDPTPLAAFPVPSAPIAASKKVLALQGLDPGLIDAEIVDSTRMVPIESSGIGLSAKTRKRLKELGIIELFAVQIALLPFLLLSSHSQRALYLPYNPPRDVCVSAPTGSGKTLAYVIPILELLSTRIIITRLRALVVLPTRDLVTQVRETFEAICKGRGLKIATATGQHSFSHEQAQLIEEPSVPLQGGSSKVDILICTPGRLIDHLKETPNFTLQHLRFLVIDEADRLLTSSFQDWLAQVLAAISPASPILPVANIPRTNVNVPNILPRHDAVAPAWLPLPSCCTRYDEKRESSCQKLLFSATLTRDPAKILSLELRDAKYFVVTDTPHPGEGGHLVAEETFAFPQTLSEHMIVCSSYKKPLILFYLIYKHNVTNALVFTKSTESTNRLVKLFECFEIALGPGSGTSRPVARAYSSDLNAQERKSMLEKFKNQEITILVCSDLISRGIDISHVSHAVSYDAPVDMRKYVHRAGRTARAGRKGDAWSLIEEQEARYFKKMLGDANHLGKVRKMKISDDDLKEYTVHYETAMKAYSVRRAEGS